MGACGLGCANRVVTARASLMVVKAIAGDASQTNWRVLSPEIFRILLSGSRSAAQWGVNQ